MQESPKVIIHMVASVDGFIAKKAGDGAIVKQTLR